jgi:hypothetical protein
MSQVLTITSQPSVNDIRSAYRPILFTVNVADTTPPKVMYCDVYVNGDYYRTISKTQYKKVYPGLSGPTDWEFDIQEVCQEVVGRHLPSYAGSNIILARPCSAVVYCRFRGSTIDADGFLVPGGTPPIQGTGSTHPVEGDGLQSNSIYALNVALQHHQNPVLATHLNSYKSGTWSSGDSFPMSHRKDNYVIGISQNDYYAIFYKGAGALSKLRLKYRVKGDDTIQQATSDVNVVDDEDDALVGDPGGLFYVITDNGDGTQTVTFYFPIDPDWVTVDIRYNDGTNHPFSGPASSPRSMTIPSGSYTYSMIAHTTLGDVLVDADVGLGEAPEAPTETEGVYFIPNGPRNLTSLFSSITWGNLKEYWVEVLDDSDTVVATSTVNRIQTWNNADHARLYFLNDCGTYDALNFLKPKGTLDVSSAKFQTAIGASWNRSDFGNHRSNVRANETKEVKRNSLETEMPWLEECVKSIEAYVDTAGTEFMSDGYMAVNIIDGKMETLKNVDDYNYQFILQYQLGNELFTVRQ